MAGNVQIKYRKRPAPGSAERGPSWVTPAVQYVKGGKGDVGPAGPPGGVPYTFSTTTTMADPGAGLLRLDNASPDSATAIALDDLSAATGNPSVAAWLSAMATSTNPVKGTLALVARDNPEIFALYHVTAVSADTGWKQIDVTYVAGSGSFTAGMACQVMFDAAGDAGDVYATAADVAAILGADAGFQADVATAAGAPNQQLVSGESVESKSYVPGGLKRFTGLNNIGGVRLKLPLTLADTGQFLMFWLDCYKYGAQASCSFLVSGYIYVNAGSPTWENTSVRQVGGDRRHPVAFGHDGANRCIQIGDLDYNWSYSIFRVRDISGNIGTEWTTLNTTPWVITVEASAPTSTYVTVYDGSDANGPLSATYDTTTDFNGLSKFNGFHRQPLSASPNAPAATVWIEQFFRGSDTQGTQIAWPAWDNTNAPYLRRLNSGTWTSWKALAWADDYVPKTGGAFTGALTGTSASFSTTLGVTGAATFGSTLAVTGAVTLSAGLGGTSASFSTTLHATGAASFGSTMTVTGAVTLSSTLAVTGSLTGTSGSFSTTLSVTGAATLSSTLGVTGAVTFGSTLAVTGATTLSSTLAVAGTLTRAGNTVRDAGNTPDGSQALALAGSDTSQRTWQAANIKDASLYWSRHQADFVAAPAVTGSDDTANVQATIDALTAGVAYFPAGTYYIDSVTLKEGVAVRGAPGGGTIFKARSNSINMLTMSATSATKTFVDIADIRFDGNGKTNVSAVYLNGVDSAKRISYIKLERLHVSGCNEGLQLYYAANTFISDCFVTGTAFGVHLDMCADTDVLATRVQNGSNAGFYIVGGAGAYDEGMRLIGCSTNGQQIGLWVSGQDWGVASGCSFTTAAGGAGIFQSSTNWKLFGSEWAVAGGTPAAAGINIDSSCSDFIVESNDIALNTYGIIASGSRHRIGGNNLKSNSNVDIYLDGVTKSTIGGNICDSSTVSWSILEAGAADYNNAQGNTGNGTFTNVGANSVFANNITY